MSVKINNMNVMGNGVGVFHGDVVIHRYGLPTDTIRDDDPILVLYNNTEVSQVRIQKFALDIEQSFAGDSNDQKNFMVNYYDIKSLDWEFFVQSGSKKPFSHFIKIELGKSPRNNFDKLVKGLRIFNQNECLNLIFPRKDPVTINTTNLQVQVGTGNQTMFDVHQTMDISDQKTNTPPEWKNLTVHDILYGQQTKSHARDRLRMEIETQFDDFNHRVEFAQFAAKKNCSMPTNTTSYTITNGEKFIQLISRFVQPKTFLKILAKTTLSNHATELKKLLKKQKEDVINETVDQLQKTSDLFGLLRKQLKDERFSDEKITMIMNSLREENFETVDDLKMLGNEQSWDEFAKLDQLKGRDKLFLRKVLIKL
uniref:Uncharacterized protein n=1 Tax=Marseillevirus LCMAC102 TaxID=2506603 RepID=A0A481YUL2_9VIRU|nr:MAG: hypothetical protein LCMAC102_02600 [Marseillevirus LCMAC102]